MAAFDEAYDDEFDDGFEDDYDDDGQFESKYLSKVPASSSAYVQPDVVMEGKHKSNPARPGVKTPSAQNKQQPAASNKNPSSSSTSTKKKAPVGATPANTPSNQSKSAPKPGPAVKQAAGGTKKAATEPENKNAKAQQQQRFQEEADFEQTLEMFGNQVRIDSMLPKTKRDFEEFGDAISQKVLQFQSNHENYFPIVEKLVKQIVGPLSYEQLNAITTSLEAIRATKTPAPPPAPASAPPPQQQSSDAAPETNATTTPSTAPNVTPSDNTSSKMDDFSDFKGGRGGKRDEDIYDDFM